MLRHLISNIENCKSVSELTKQIVLDASQWISKSWNTTASDTVVKCFSDAGFPTENLSADADSDEDSDDDDIPLSRLQTVRDQIDLTNLTSVTECENDIPTEETYDGEWEKNYSANLFIPMETVQQKLNLRK